MIGITARTAMAALQLQGTDIHALMAEANAARLRCRGPAVHLCGVVNAKSGHCPEDCRFCAQSAHSTAEIDTYPLLDQQQIVDAAQLAEYNRASRVGIVTAGGALNDRAELDTIRGAVSRIAAELAVEPCASLGCLGRPALEELHQAGLTRYHHNLETAESYFEQVCTTRSWAASVETVNTARAVGLSVCCGGIFGLGESPAQRIELLESLRALEVDSVPLNFFNPVPGNRIGAQSPLTPLECLKLVAVARLMMPHAEIRVCGGREHNLRDLQSWALIAGADGLMVGGYLTTDGREVDHDLAMILDAGFEIAGDVAAQRAVG